MKPTSTLFTLAVAAGLHTATATIALGNYGTDTVAWIDGGDPCNPVTLLPAEQNPCEHPFTLDNGYTYVLKYCGTKEYALFNGDGSFNSQPQWEKKTITCNNGAQNVVQTQLFH